MPADQTKIAFFNDLTQQGDGSADWTIYIDNLDQTTGGNAGPTIALPVDFEEAADAYEIAGFDGGVATVEAGPDGAKSLKYVKGAGQNWAGVWINLDTAVDGANGQIITADVHSTVAREIALKFDAANVERKVNHSGTGWEAMSFDFTGDMPANQTKIAFFNDLTQQGDGSADWTIYIDNLDQTTGGTAGPAAPNNLLLEDFSGSPTTEIFEGLTSATVEADPVSGGTNGSTLKLITNPGGNGWQGATIKFAAGSYANISTNKTIAVDVHATSAISIMAKVEDESFSSPAAANTQTHTGSGWETLIFKFTTGSDNTATANGTYTKVALFPNRKADDTGWNNPVVDQTIYVDNIKSTEAAPQHQNGLQDGDETGVDCGGASAPACAQSDPVPTDAPTTPPSRNSWDVISVYGEAYGTPIGLNNTTWDKTTFEDETIAGNVVLKAELVDGDFIGADLGSKINATNMTHFHIDYWMAGDLLTGQTMNTKWSNHAGGNAETSAFSDYNTGPEVGSWKSRDIDITALTDDTSRDELAQLIISLAAAGGTHPATIYIDNVYFYRAATASINDIESNVNVYPNPVENTLNVSAAVVIDAVSIFDLTGREVMRAKPNATAFSLDVADLNKGLYLVTVKAGKQELTTKLVK